MSNVVRAALSRAVKAGTFGKGLGYDSSKTSGGETLDARDDIAATEVEDASTIDTLSTYLPVFSKLAVDSADTQLNTPLIASGLSVTLPAAGTYDIEALLFYTTAAAADIQFKFGGTATVTVTAGVSDLTVINAPFGDATAAKVPTLVATSWTTAFSILTTGAPADATPVLVKGTIVATVAGTITITFAQVTTDATNTHVGAGSTLTARRVA